MWPRSSFAIGLLFVFAVGGFSPTPAQAVLIDNGPTTIDTVAGLEWLDVTAAQGRSWTQITLGLGGIIADGYHLARASELCGLLSSLGDSLPNCTNLAFGSPSDLVRASTAATFNALLGTTFSSGDFNAVNGWIQGPNFESGEIANATILEFGALSSVHTTHNTSDGFDRSDPNLGFFLVRPWVELPEPSTALMLAMVLAGLRLARRRR